MKCIQKTGVTTPENRRVSDSVGFDSNVAIKSTEYQQWKS